MEQPAKKYVKCLDIINEATTRNGGVDSPHLSTTLFLEASTILTLQCEMSHSWQTPAHLYLEWCRLCHLLDNTPGGPYSSTQTKYKHPQHIFRLTCPKNHSFTTSFHHPERCPLCQTAEKYALTIIGGCTYTNENSRIRCHCFRYRKDPFCGCPTPCRHKSICDQDLYITTSHIRTKKVLFSCDTDHNWSGSERNIIATLRIFEIIFKTTFDDDLIDPPYSPGSHFPDPPHYIAVTGYNAAKKLAFTNMDDLHSASSLPAATLYCASQKIHLLTINTNTSTPDQVKLITAALSSLNFTTDSPTWLLNRVRCEMKKMNKSRKLFLHAETFNNGLIAQPINISVPPD